MSRPPPSGLSLSTLAGLADLAGTRPAPVTAPGRRERFFGATGTGNTYSNHNNLAGCVTHVPALPDHDGATDEWEERAAILEFEGGWPRTTAEAIATRLMLLNQMDSTSEERRALDRELAAFQGRGPVSGRRATRG